MALLQMDVLKSVSRASPLLINEYWNDLVIIAPLLCAYCMPGVAAEWFNIRSYSFLSIICRKGILIPILHIRKQKFTDVKRYVQAMQQVISEPEFKCRTA